MFWRDALCTSAECRRGKAPGEPYDGKRHVRFDEGTLETEQWARRLMPLVPVGSTFCR